MHFDPRAFAAKGENVSAYAIPAVDVTRLPDRRKLTHPKRDRPALPTRTCEHPGCITILSAYNRGPTCLAHTEPRRVFHAEHKGPAPQMGREIHGMTRKRLPHCRVHERWTASCRKCLASWDPL